MFVTSQFGSQSSAQLPESHPHAPTHEVLKTATICRIYILPVKPSGTRCSSKVQHASCSRTNLVCARRAMASHRHCHGSRGDTAQDRLRDIKKWLESNASRKDGMQTKRFIAAIALLTLAAWCDADPEWPASGAMPDEPGHASRFKYEAINAGTRSYRPVDPMPWGDVNRHVAPAAGTSPVAPDATPKTPDTPNAPMPMEQHDHH